MMAGDGWGGACAVWRVWRVRGAVCVTTRLCMALLGVVAARGSGERGERRDEGGANGGGRAL